MVTLSVDPAPAAPQTRSTGVQVRTPGAFVSKAPLSPQGGGGTYGLGRICLGDGRCEDSEGVGSGPGPPPLERGGGGRRPPGPGPGRLHGTVHGVEQLPLLVRLPPVLPEEAPSPQGVPHGGAAAGQEQGDAQGPVVSPQLPQGGQAGRVQEQQRGTVDDHGVEAGGLGHQSSRVAHWAPACVLEGLSLDDPRLRALLLPPGSCTPRVQPREAVEGPQEEVLVGVVQRPCKAEDLHPGLGDQALELRGVLIEAGAGDAGEQGGVWALRAADQAEQREEQTGQQPGLHADQHAGGRRGHPDQCVRPAEPPQLREVSNLAQGAPQADHDDAAQHAPLQVPEQGCQHQQHQQHHRGTDHAGQLRAAAGGRLHQALGQGGAGGKAVEESGQHVAAAHGQQLLVGSHRVAVAAGEHLRQRDGEGGAHERQGHGVQRHAPHQPRVRHPRGHEASGDVAGHTGTEASVELPEVGHERGPHDDQQFRGQRHLQAVPAAVRELLGGQQHDQAHGTGEHVAQVGLPGAAQQAQPGEDHRAWPLVPGDPHAQQVLQLGGQDGQRGPHGEAVEQRLREEVGRAGPELQLHSPGWLPGPSQGEPAPPRL
ncbi:alpha-L-iduronidase isoform X3 [Phyllostomus hastatus]|uniref:alpha-L-iduronidase isoform X3 n=1 Tax=Phyllostomus hastatus TaxID=9423 RepID=UPI001E67E952|nr:alpha-L-iduronidase isoform X3 [Phyllostomus hastatus]